MIRIAELVNREKLRSVALFVMAIGFFIQLAGKIFIESSSARNTQVYLCLLFPALCAVFYRVVLRRAVQVRALYLPWGLYLAWVALTTIWATGGDDSALSLAKRGLFIGLFLVAVALLMQDDRYLRRALLAGVAVVAFGALASLTYQYAVLDQPLAYRAFRIYSLGWRDFADFRWPVAAGIFYGAIATWALGIAIDRATGRWASVWFFCCFMVISLYVLLTYTRGAWIGLMAAVVLSVFMQRTRRGWWFLILAVGAVLVAIGSFWPQLVIEFQQNKLSGRGAIWDYYLEVMPGHWLIGHGLGTPFEYLWDNGVTVSPHAHSLYLQQVYDSGLISLAFLLVGMVWLLVKGWQLKDEYWVRLAYPAYVFSLIAMLTDIERLFTRPGDYWTVFWMPVAILLAVANRGHSR
ncbi:O-Antigen ligase [compost metagenome]